MKSTGLSEMINTLGLGETCATEIQIHLTKFVFTVPQGCKEFKFRFGLQKEQNNQCQNV